MRYVPTNCLTEGMMVAQTIYGKNKEILLVADTLLTKQYIDTLARLRFMGVYINDDISKDIEIRNVISTELRLQAVSGIKKLFLKPDDDRPHIQSQMVMEQVESIISELLSNDSVMLNMIDLKFFDNYTYAHSVNVCVLSLVIGLAAGFSQTVLTKLGLGAILHDIGVVFINKRILNKPGRLTKEEYIEVENHTALGFDYTIEKFKIPEISSMCILDHHERYNGTGYPNSKTASDISFFGRIIAVADVYDALTSERPYREAWSPSESMEYIIANSGILFDPDVVKLFMHKVSPYPIGTTVKLNNGYTAVVLENFEALCLRPRVRVISTGADDINSEPFELDLHNDFSALNITVNGIAPNL